MDARPPFPLAPLSYLIPGTCHVLCPHAHVVVVPNFLPMVERAVRHLRAMPCVIRVRKANKGTPCQSPPRPLLLRTENWASRARPPFLPPSLPPSFSFHS